MKINYSTYYTWYVCNFSCNIAVAIRQLSSLTINTGYDFHGTSDFLFFEWESFGRTKTFLGSLVSNYCLKMSAPNCRTTITYIFCSLAWSIHSRSSPKSWPIGAPGRTAHLALCLPVYRGVLHDVCQYNVLKNEGFITFVFTFVL